MKIWNFLFENHIILFFYNDRYFINRNNIRRIKRGDESKEYLYRLIRQCGNVLYHNDPTMWWMPERRDPRTNVKRNVSQKFYLHEKYEFYIDWLIIDVCCRLFYISLSARMLVDVMHLLIFAQSIYLNNWVSTDFEVKLSILRHTRKRFSRCPMHCECLILFKCFYSITYKKKKFN